MIFLFTLFLFCSSLNDLNFVKVTHVKITIAASDQTLIFLDLSFSVHQTDFNRRIGCRAFDHDCDFELQGDLNLLLALHLLTIILQISRGSDRYMHMYNSKVVVIHMKVCLSDRQSYPYLLLCLETGKCNNS